MTPELYDQEGFIIRIGVGGAIRIGDKLVRAPFVDVVVNDDLWKGVQYIDARTKELEGELGNPSAYRLPRGAFGNIEIMSVRDDPGDPIVEPARRILALDPDSVLAIVINDPDDGRQLRRITFHGCRWDPPAAHHVGNRLVVAGSFKAEWFEDT